MTRFHAEIEFSLDWDDASVNDAESELKDCLHHCKPLVIKSIVKTSITHQEALKQIQELLDETDGFGNVICNDIQSILNKVA
jgi:hypothetical protein